MSKYARKSYYIIKSGDRVISKHYKLSTAKKKVNAAYKRGHRYRIYNQDGRAFY